MKSIYKVMFVVSALLLFVPGYSAAKPAPPRDHRSSFAAAAPRAAVSFAQEEV